MPDCERVSTSLIALVFFAVRSSSSLVFSMIGVLCWRTYFLVVQPTLIARLAAIAKTSAVRFIGGAPLGNFAGRSDGACPVSTASRRRPCPVRLDRHHYGLCCCKHGANRPRRASNKGLWI